MRHLVPKPLIHDSHPLAGPPLHPHLMGGTSPRPACQLSEEAGERLSTLPTQEFCQSQASPDKRL